MNPPNTTRRDFLRSAAAVTAAASLGSAWSARAGGQENSSPNERIGLGVIGFGPRCTYDLKAMLQFPDVRCIALAEVQAKRREAGKSLVDSHYGNRDCAVHRDFRELLDRKDIDAVLIATGDRWHAAASILAAQAGKDVYSEKPCGLTIELCQQLDSTFQRTKRIFQAGTQRRSVPNFRTAIELAHTGKLGKLKTLYASVYFPSIRTEWLASQPTPDPNVVDWNLWLGPAPWRPYNAGYVNGNWRGYWDFDSGAQLLDWGAHTLDLCQWANQADDTMPIEYEPAEDRITCRYENGVVAVLDFLKQPFGDRSPNYISRLGTCPVRFEGEEGSVETGDSGEIVVRPEILSKHLPQEYKRVRGLDVAEHARNFFDSMKSRQPTVCNSSVMRHSHVACHAAALSWILQRKLKFDPQKEEFIDDDEANRLRSRAARNWA